MKHATKLLIVLTIACVLTALACSNPPPDPQTIEEAVAFVRQSAAEIETWSAEIEMTFTDRSTKMTYSMQGKGGKMAAEVSMDMRGQITKTRMVLDADGIIWGETDMNGRIRVMKTDVNVMLEKEAQEIGLSVSGGFQDPTKALDSFAEIYDLEFGGKHGYNQGKSNGRRSRERVGLTASGGNE